MVEEGTEQKIEPKVLNTPVQEEEEFLENSGIHIREIPNVVLQSPINHENLMITESIVSTNNPLSDLYSKYKFRKTRIPKISKENFNFLKME